MRRQIEQQLRYCPNCGSCHYDTNIQIKHVLSMCCDDRCREEWQLKYASSLLGRRNAEEVKKIEKENQLDEKT